MGRDYWLSFLNATIKSPKDDLIWPRTLLYPIKMERPVNASLLNFKLSSVINWACFSSIPAQNHVRATLKMTKHRRFKTRNTSHLGINQRTCKHKPWNAEVRQLIDKHQKTTTNNPHTEAMTDDETPDLGCRFVVDVRTNSDYKSGECSFGAFKEVLRVLRNNNNNNTHSCFAAQWQFVNSVCLTLDEQRHYKMIRKSFKSISSSINFPNIDNPPVFVTLDAAPWRRPLRETQTASLTFFRGSSWR